MVKFRLIADFLNMLYIFSMIPLFLIIKKNYNIFFNLPPLLHVIPTATLNQQSGVIRVCWNNIWKNAWKLSIFNPSVSHNIYFKRQHKKILKTFYIKIHWTNKLVFSLLSTSIFWSFPKVCPKKSTGKFRMLVLGFYPSNKKWFRKDINVIWAKKTGWFHLVKHVIHVTKLFCCVPLFSKPLHKRQSKICQNYQKNVFVFKVLSVFYCKDTFVRCL